MNKILMVIVLAVLMVTLVACDDATNKITNKIEVGLSEVTGNIEGTYLVAYGDYYAAPRDEVIKIEKSGDDTFNIYWVKYDGSEISASSVIAIAEEVPVGEFNKNTYVVLLGDSNMDLYNISFKEKEKLRVEGEMWVFAKTDIKLELAEAVADFKNMYSHMDYKYSSYSQNVEIIYWENASGYNEAISFYEKWYKQFNTFKGVGSLKIKKNNSDIIDILWNDNVYCSFRENDYVIGESYDYVTYKGVDGTEFDFYPLYEDYMTHDVRPLIRFKGVRDDSIPEDIRKNYSDKINYYIGNSIDFLYDENAYEIKENFDKEWYYSYNTFANNLYTLQIELSENNLVVNINDEYYCSCELVDYSWDEENKCVYYPSGSTGGISYYTETNIIKIDTGKYAGQYKYIDNISESFIEEATTNQETENNNDDLTQDYDWYLDYNLFANQDETVSIEVCSIDDRSFTMTWEDIYWDNPVEHNWQFQIDVTPDEIGNDGEFIYKGDGGRIIYYPYENYISVEMDDEDYDGKYYFYSY